MKFVEPLFGLGTTLSGTDDDGNLINDEALGTIYEFPSRDLSSSGIRGNKTRLTDRPIVAVALRNESGLTLYGKRVAKLTETAGYSLLESVDGYAAELADGNVVIIDEFLETDGVADDDIFWGIISGPVTVLTSTVGADFNGDIAVGSPLVAGTGSTTGNSTSGRVSNVTLAGQTAATAAFSMAHNLVGVALSAKTTGNTAADLLINAKLQYI
jgi:hypothetical protein